MRGREHIAIGVGSTVLGLWALRAPGSDLDLLAVLAASGAAAAGSLGPDLDHPGSLASVSIPVALVGYSGMFLLARWYESGHLRGLPIGLASLGPESVRVAWAFLMAGVGLFVLSLLLGAVFGHRGAVHSVVFGLLATAVVWYGLLVVGWPVWLCVPFAWGWIAHLIADASTPAGLRSVLWPLGQRA